MGKFVHDDVIDAAHDVLVNDCDKATICSRMPTTYTEANATYALGEAVPAFTGPANGDVSGRKLTVDAIAGADVDSSGNANHLALLDTSGERLLRTTPIYLVRENTAQAGASSAITLDSGASSTDDVYNGCAVVKWDVDVDGNPENVEDRLITDYVGSTKVATVNSAWAANPDSSSKFKVFGQQVTSGNTWSLDAFDIEIEDPRP